MSQAAADALVVEADELLRAEKFADAAARYEKASKLFPPHGLAWRGLGHSLLRLGRPHEAARAFDQAIGLLPDSATTLWGGAVAHAEIGNKVVAKRYLQRTLGLQPTWIGMARGIPQLAELLQTSTRARAALTSRLGAFSARAYQHASDSTRVIEVGRIVDQPVAHQLTFVTLGLANQTWSEPQRPRIELLLASTVDADLCGTILSNLAFHLVDAGFYPEPGVLVRDAIGALGIDDLSRRLPHVYITVPRAWELPLPLDEGPPAITLAQVVPVSEGELALWRDNPAELELALAAREVEVADLRRA